MVRYQLAVRSYDRHFSEPLRTAYGAWSVRSGLIIQLTDQDGYRGYGEIAPLPWFGSETISTAWDFCQQMIPTISQDQLTNIPDSLPACQFGFTSAWDHLQWSRQTPPEIFLASQKQFTIPGSVIPTSALLPTGAEGIKAWKKFWERGDLTFKWKIGVTDIDQELGWFHQLVAALPAAAQLRLDANGSLTIDKAGRWLAACDALAENQPQVEFIEQPLAPHQFSDLLALSQNYATPLALDESVAQLNQIKHCYQQGWRGIFVIKPAIAGSIAQLQQCCHQWSLDVVISSVFETAVASWTLQSLAQNLSHRAAGLGIHHWFTDGWHTYQPWEFQQLWDQL